MSEPAPDRPPPSAPAGVRLRLLGAGLALAAGTAAIVIAILLIRSALS